MNKNSILASICSVTYNQKDYIRKSLDSLLMQKTNFKYEIIIHDDCSTDGTTDIVREYAKQYPDIIIPILEEENQYQKGNTRIIATFMYPKVRGKYVAICEGDDYWNDPQKLQKQVDYMESHDECSMMVSNGYGYIEDMGKTILLNPIPIVTSRYLAMEEILKESNGLIPTASTILRKELIVNEPEWSFKAPVGDRPLRMWCAINGKVFYDVNPMVTYRRGSAGSFTLTVRKDIDYAYKIYSEMETFFDAFDCYTQQKFHKEVQYMKDREEYYFYNRVGNYDALVKCPYFLALPRMKRYKRILSIKYPAFYEACKKVKDLLPR